MAPKEDISDWQLQCGQIRERAAHILKAQQWADCSFIVGTAAERVEIKTHRLILAMASPVFEAMFYGPIAEGNAPVDIPDMEPAALKALIEYIYTDNITINTHTMACELYYGAQKYMLPHLQTVCTAYLSQNLTTDVVCTVYEFALMVGEEALVKDCEKLIKFKTDAVLKGSSFLEAQLDTVEKIFSMQPLNVENELVLIRAADQYNRMLKKNRTAKMFEKVMEKSNDNLKDKLSNFSFRFGSDKTLLETSSEGNVAKGASTDQIEIFQPKTSSEECVVKNSNGSADKAVEVAKPALEADKEKDYNGEKGNGKEGTNEEKASIKNVSSNVIGKFGDKKEMRQVNATALQILDTIIM